MWEPILVVNLLLCLLVLFIGWMGYKKSKKTVPLFIGLAFGLFAATHLFTIFGLKKAFLGASIIIRIIAYLMVCLAVWRSATKSKEEEFKQS
jgi:multisubunit Na+/H+ antiporter MnhE subunit